MGKKPVNQPIRINVEDLEDMICKECGCGAFLKNAVKLKFLSYIQSPNGKDQIVESPPVNACIKCGGLPVRRSQYEQKPRVIL